MTFVFLSSLFNLCLKIKLHFLFQAPAGAVEERSGEDDNSNVQDEIKNKYNK